MILHRFTATDDALSRVLARFRAPSAEEASSLEAFMKRFLDRIGGPIAAYEEVHSTVPPATSRSLMMLHRLVASGTFVDKHPGESMMAA